MFVNKPGVFRGTSSNTWGSGYAISARCPDTPGGILRPLSAFAAGIRSAAASDSPPHGKPPGEAGTLRAEKSSHNSGNAVLPYGALSHSGQGEKFRN